MTLYQLGKRIPKKTQEEYQQLKRKGRDISSFPKLSPYYSKHVCLTIYLEQLLHRWMGMFTVCTYSLSLLGVGKATCGM